MKLLLAIATVFALAPSAWAQNAVPPSAPDLSLEIAHTQASYYKCVLASAARLASLKELPQDIISAAFGYCLADRATYSDALLKFMVRDGGVNAKAAREFIDSQLAKADEELRHAAMRELFKSRYPQLK